MSVTFTALAATGDWAKGTGQVTYAGAAEVNCCNANAAELLALLGFTHPAGPYEAQAYECPEGAPVAELAGGCDPVDFEGRILIAEAFLPQTSDGEGRPATEDGGPGTGQALVVDCGRAAGYLAGRLGELRQVAHEAQLHAAEVVWS